MQQRLAASPGGMLNDTKLEVYKHSRITLASALHGSNRGWTGRVANQNNSKRKRNDVGSWIESYLGEEEPRSKSLIISAFGDSIAPYSEGIWLGELIELMAPLGLNERLVRTSAFRLIEEGWLRARREGRRSYYTLTEAGQHKFEKAYSHIYDPPEVAWDGRWTMVILPRQVEASSDRSDFKRDLSWSGFASLTAGLYVHPSVGVDEVALLVERCNLADQVIVMRAMPADAAAGGAGDQALLESWSLPEIGSRYQAFVDRFLPLANLIRHRALTPRDAFLVQTLLIHSFRRTNLDDPRLPLSLLPQDWPGLTAFELCREIYRHTYGLTAEYLSALPGFESMDPAGSRLQMAVGLRFGGLDADVALA